MRKTWRGLIGAMLACFVVVPSIVAAAAPASADVPGQSTIKINEVESDGDPQGDWIELTNIGAEAVDVGGWILRDNKDDDAFAIPSGTSVAAGGYQAFVVDGVGGFGLGKADSARLYLPDGATMVDSYTWTDHAATTYGRCPDGTGEFVTTGASTFGAANDCNPPGYQNITINEVESNGDATDWIELYNTGAFPVDLSGWILRDDKDADHFDIPAGTTIAASGFQTFDVSAAFGLGAPDEARLYLPDGATKVDEYDWTTHATVTYGRCPDGTGSFVDTAGSTKNGPNDCGAATTSAVKINEVESSGDASDWIELYNTGSQAIDLTGYAVADDTDSHKYTIPSGTIAAGGFFVVDGTDSGIGLGAPDEARFFAPDGTLLDSYSWTEHAATTYGRCPDGIGAFATTASSTKGAANDCGTVTPPPASGVVINEANSNGADFIELYNNGDAAADISGDVLRDNEDTPDHAFTIPAGTTIAAHGYYLANALPFGLGDVDSARLFAPDGTTLLDSYSWTVHGTTTFGRCPDGAGAFAATAGATPGTANNCAVTPPPDQGDGETWPGGQQVATADGVNVFGENLSGLAYQGTGTTTPGTLWAVRNGPSTLYRLNDAAGTWSPTTTQQLRYPDGTGDPDAEGVTLVNGDPSNGVYVSTERDNTNNQVNRFSVLRYDPSQTTGDLAATTEWNLTGDIPAVATPNLGLEGIAWVPDSALTAGGFVDQSTGSAYDPADYPLHGSGLFFVGVEATGRVYAYALNSDGTFQKIDTITSGFPSVMELEWAPDTSQLWVVCDDTCQGETKTFDLTGGQFVASHTYNRPTGMANLNNEGFAITPDSECVNGLKPVFWSDDSNDDQHALRTGTIDCGADAVEAWPGGQSVATVDDAGFVTSNLSGLAYQGTGSATPGTIWAVQNGPSTLFAMNQAAPDHWTASSTWTMTFPGGAGEPDSEGVTLVNGDPSNGVYVSTERDNTNNQVNRFSVLKYDPPAGGGTASAATEWNLTSSIPPVATPNLGLEGIAWVPDSALIAGGLIDQSTGAAYDPAAYPMHGTGLFFVGLEATGMVYGYALNSDGTFTLVDQFRSGFPSVMELEWDPENSQLWAVCDDTCQGETKPFALTDGQFALQHTYARPTGMGNFNNEGFTIAPQSECVDGLKPVFWSDDSDDGGFSLRAGTIDCTPAATPPSTAVKINEVESSDGVPGDWIELYNASADPVDLSGYIVRDDDDAHTYALPAGATIAGNGFYVVEEADMGFGLGGADEARLFGPDGATLLDSYSWTTAAAVTYGRCPDGTGDFQDTTTSTKGAANDCSPPVVPPSTAVKINEVESDDAGSPDWVELYNTSDEPVDISGYTLRSGQDSPSVAIPAGTTIAALGFYVASDPSFDLAAADSVRFLGPDGTTLLDSYSWTTAAAGTYGRCADGTGDFQDSSRPTKGFPNDCTGAPAAETWPGGPEVSPVDDPDLTTGNLSGLAYQGGSSAAPGTIWAVQNGKPSALYEMNQVGPEHWTASDTWQIQFPDGTGQPDAEGVTLVNGDPSNGVYVSIERDNNVSDVNRFSVLEYDPPAGGGPVSATTEWNLTGSIPPVATPNLGLEAIAWVPDSALLAGGFVDQSTGQAYAPASYPLHGTGIFFVGVEATGMIYGYALNSDGTFVEVDSFASGFPSIMELEWEPETSQLWAACDDTCEGQTRTFGLGVPTVQPAALGPLATAADAGQFTQTHTYSRPAGMGDFNNEGFTIAPQLECVDGVKPAFWADDGDDGGQSLREGTIDCTPADVGTTPPPSDGGTTPPPPSDGTTPPPPDGSTQTPTPTPSPTPGTTVPEQSGSAGAPGGSRSTANLASTGAATRSQLLAAIAALLVGAAFIGLGARRRTRRH